MICSCVGHWFKNIFLNKYLIYWNKSLRIIQSVCMRSDQWLCSEIKISMNSQLSQYISYPCVMRSQKYILYQCDSIVFFPQGKSLHIQHFKCFFPSRDIFLFLPLIFFCSVLLMQVKLYHCTKPGYLHRAWEDYL